MRKLLEAGADVNISAAGQMTALLWATVEGHEDVVEILLQQPGILLNVPDMWGRTPLENASSIGYTEIVKMLLEARANIGMALIEGSEDQEIVAMLLNEGADVNEADIDGMTALISASEHGHKDVVKKLLTQEGINVNLWNNDGETALILASKNGHIEIVKMLLKAGAHVNMVEDVLRVPLISTVNMMDVEGEEDWKEDAKTALMMASQEGHTKIVKILLAAGADVNAVANDGYDTAMTLANTGGHDEIVELLIRNGATIPEGDYQRIRDMDDKIQKEITTLPEIAAMMRRKTRKNVDPQFPEHISGWLRKKTQKGGKKKRKTQKKNPKNSQ